MSVIIRLQNLPWSANALDIRQFFQGLSIPEGGVHIVGGELGDAFIAFSTDEDARQAFNRNGGKIKEIQVKLMLSSRTEMQKVIEAARAQSYAAFLHPNPTPAPLPAIIPPVLPAAVPELKKDDKDKDSKRDRRRSRSKSRDRKDRSRDRDRRDRRHRDRSRSRSRERRDRRRRDRSRTRSRDRDRTSRDERRSREGKKPEERNPNAPRKNEAKPVWANQQSPDIPNNLVSQNNQSHVPVFATRSVDDQRQANNAIPFAFSGGNGFSQNNFNRPRDNNWPQNNFPNLSNQSNFNNREFGNNQNNSRLNSLPLGNANRRDNFQARNNCQRQNEGDYDNDTCVKLSPFYGGYGDVRRFFQGLFISNKGIKFINDEQGHRTGLVYIQFGHPQGKSDALRKDGENLNGITVDVAHLDDEEFENAVDRYLPPMEGSVNHDDEEGGRNFKSRNITKYFNKQTKTLEPEIKDFSCVIVDDLPTYVKEQDILHMFSLHPLFSLILTTKPRGGNIAYVKFSTKEVALKAYEEKQHHVVSGKQVTVRPCTDEEFDLINKEHEVDLTGGKVAEIGTDCVLMSKLPQQINDRDIADFFSDIGVIPLKIHLISNQSGFTGQAYCEFETNEEAGKAIKKDETLLGNVPISVKPVDRNDMMVLLGQTLPANVEPKQNIHLPPYKNKSSNHQTDAPSRNMLPNMHQNDMNVRMHHPPLNHNHRPFFNRNFGGPGFMGSRGGPRFGPRGGGPRFRFNGPPQNERNMDGLEDAPEGCTVYMDNVPYKAGTNDILEFFDGYNVTNNVSRRYNPNNTPSAEARVIFPTPEEAFRAVQEKSGEKIWDRPIFLKQA